MWQTTSSNGVFTIYMNMQPPQPRCSGCGQSPHRKAPDGKLWCNRCFCIEAAEEVFTLLLSATDPAARSRVYRALSTAFHPDAGGDERLMVALNLVYERFK